MKPARFLNHPQVSWKGGHYPWQLDAPLRYHSDILQRLQLPEDNPGLLCIPAGYCTDFASVPRIPVVYASVGGKAVLPAIVHDYLYDCWPPRLTRKQADQVFLEAMQTANDPPSAITRRLMYWGVRLGGALSWHKDTTHKCERGGTSR